MTTEEAVHRGNNLVGVTIAALSGLAFFPEFFLESEGIYKFDEVALLLVGIAGVVWYLIGTHSLRRSVVPLVLLGADLIIKIIGLVIEFGDQDDASDEYSTLILFALALILVAWLYVRSRNAAQSS